MAARDAEAVLASNSSGSTATIDPKRDHGEPKLESGWRQPQRKLLPWIVVPGAFDSPSTGLVVLFDGQSTTPENAVVVLEKVPTSFIDQFCQSFSGSGSSSPVSSKQTRSVGGWA